MTRSRTLLLVTRWRSLTVAKVDSIGLVVRGWIPVVPGSEVLESVRVGFGETGLKFANNRADLA